MPEPRISPLAASEFTDEIRELLALPLGRHRNDEAEVPEFLGILVHHPGLYRRYAGFAGKLLVAGKLPARVRELAILRNAWLCRAPFEWAGHVKIAHEAGMSSEEIDRITIGSEALEWDPFDKAVVKASEELHEDSKISEATWEVLAERLDKRQLIELLMVIGAYRMIGWLQNSLEIRLQPNSKGLEER